MSLVLVIFHEFMSIFSSLINNKCISCL